MAKGAQWERDISRTLSQWWAGHDDVFWRTSQSGGRATSRRKKDMETVGQAADITATNPIGLPFIKMFAVECKKGYHKDTPFDVLDKLPRFKLQTFEEWVHQANAASVRMKSVSWMLIFKRTGRESMVAMPGWTWRDTVSKIPDNASHMRWVEKTMRFEVIIMPLETMLDGLTPHMIRKYLQGRGK